MAALVSERGWVADSLRAHFVSRAARNEEIVRRYLAGETMQTIATGVDLSRNGVASILHRSGIRKRLDLSVMDSKIVRRYTSGESPEKIAISIGTCPEAVRYRLKKNGVVCVPGRLAKGRPFAEDHKKKLSISRRLSGIAKGERNPNWRGGKQSNWEALRNSAMYKDWRKSVYSRDGYTCQGCGDARGKNLHAHHILPRSKFPEFTFAVRNGITLCVPCHEKTMGREMESAPDWQKIVDSVGEGR